MVDWAVAATWALATASTAAAATSAWAAVAMVKVSRAMAGTARDELRFKAGMTIFDSAQAMMVLLHKHGFTAEAQELADAAVANDFPRMQRSFRRATA